MIRVSLPQLCVASPYSHVAGLPRRGHGRFPVVGLYYPSMDWIRNVPKAFRKNQKVLGRCQINRNSLGNNRQRRQINGLVQRLFLQEVRVAGF